MVMSWDRAPTWANFQAMHSDGTVWYFEFEPTFCLQTYRWIADGRTELDWHTNPPPIPDWAKHTLSRRYVSAEAGTW